MNHRDDRSCRLPRDELFKRMGNHGFAADRAILLRPLFWRARALAATGGHDDNSDRYRLRLMHLRHKSPKSRICTGALTAWRTEFQHLPEKYQFGHCPPWQAI
jgi:hypothetical protein